MACDDTPTPTSDSSISRADAAVDATPYFTEDPVHVHLNWSDDPTRTIAVLWAAAEGTAAGAVRYGPSPDALSMSADAVAQTVGTRLFGMVTVHEAHLSGLSPDTTYYYQVGIPGHLSEVHHFKTAPAPMSQGDVNFIVSGDSRDDMTIWRAIQQRALQVTARTPPDFELFTGDAALFGAIQVGWNLWFDAAREGLADLPWIMVHGNHEALSNNYLAQFAQPPTPGGELYFSMDYGPIHFLVLNDTLVEGTAGLSTGPQIEFMQRDLAAVDRTRTPWVIATHHKSPYTSSMHASDDDVMALRQAWTPIYDRFHVDIVLNGHDHDFEVTRPLRDHVVVPDGQGTVYVISGGAGAELYPANMSPVTRYAERTQNFLSLHVTRTTLEMTPYRIDGSIIPEGVVRLHRM